MNLPWAFRQDPVFPLRMRSLWGAVFLAVTWAMSAAPTVVLENAYLRYGISATGQNLEFTDRATGVNYLRQKPSSPCAQVRIKGQTHPVTSAVLTEGRLLLGFSNAGVQVALRVEMHPAYLQLTVDSVTGNELDALTFVNIPLTLQARPEEPFGACAYSLNLNTRVDALPALQRDLIAGCERKFGLIGAQAALVGVPMAEMLPTLRTVLTQAKDLPLCKVAGPWAHDVPFNHGSYLFNFGTLTRGNVADWIANARRLGVSQIDHHGGPAFFRFGDFELNREKWPGGWETFQQLVQQLNDAGIGSIFHTYAFFIDKQSRYVTPVPDPRLDAFRTFTLADGISAEAAEIPVNESTKGLSTVTGFFEHNSVMLHVGDELMTFSGVAQEPPWRFTGVKRGALGTRAAAHPVNTPARHLKECFGLLVPDVESTLFTEIARRHAEIVNQCGFKGIYLDAIDGSSILRGPDECWYWADKFVLEIQRHLRPAVGMEMSAMWHHFWQYRTRWQAWDYPQRGHKRFIDLHAEAVNGGLLLPLHLGWWNFQSFNPPQVEPSYPDVIEYLGAKLIGWDAGISLTGAIDAERLKKVPLFQRAVDILRTCEELRRAGTVSPALRAQLRAPGKEFALVQENGVWRFHPAQYHAQAASLQEPWSLEWQVDNALGDQPLRLRLEALMSAKPYDDSNNVVLADWSEPNERVGAARCAEGVAVRLESGSRQPEFGLTALVATNAARVAAHAAWARFDRAFTPPRNLKTHQAIGLTVEGDGSGAILAVRLESPRHLAFGALADRYLKMDFTGRRVVTLIETESTRWNDYVWNDGKWLYNAYRETIDFAAVDSVSLWLNNLVPGKETRCALGPIKALPMVSCKLRNPVVSLNGASVVFPVEMTSGMFLECNGAADCKLYGPDGNLVASVTPRGALPRLRAGKNKVQFNCDAAEGVAPRARIVLMGRGPALHTESGSPLSRR